MNRVLDASAQLAFLNQEPGGERVLDLMEGAAMSAVNWTEVVQKSLRSGTDVKGMREEVEDLGLIIAPFTPAQADQAAHLWETTRTRGPPWPTVPACHSPSSGKRSY